MKPGDLFQWVYTTNNKQVIETESLYSTPMGTWVPIGGISLFLSESGLLEMSWVNKYGVFHAQKDAHWPRSILAGSNIKLLVQKLNKE